MKKSLYIVVLFLLLMAFYIPMKLFLIGEPVDSTQLYIETAETNQTLHISIHATEAAVALRGWKLQQKGSTLYIHVRKVLVSPLFRSGSYATTIDITPLSEIRLGSQQIWFSSKKGIE